MQHCAEVATTTLTSVLDADVDDSGYAITSILGRGGNATVYLATAGDGRVCALKVLHPDHRDDRHLARLHREFSLADQLHHPHVIDVYEHRTHWLAMQYIDGGNIGGLSDEVDQLTALTQIAAALDAVHHLGIVHCDVKPANILVFQDFSAHGAVLIDFGVAISLAEDMAARLAHDGRQRLSLDPARRITHQRVEPAHLQASLHYSAPELLLNRFPSAATDQYSLACTAVELLTGAPPFIGNTSEELIDAHLQQIPPRISDRTPRLPHAVDNIIVRAMSKDAERRYDSCTDFVSALTDALDAGPRSQ